MPLSLSPTPFSHALSLCLAFALSLSLSGSLSLSLSLLDGPTSEGVPAVKRLPGGREVSERARSASLPPRVCLRGELVRMAGRSHPLQVYKALTRAPPQFGCSGCSLVVLGSLSSYPHVFVVGQAIVMVLESKGERTFKMVLQLLKFLWVSTVITADQMRRVRCTTWWSLCSTALFSTFEEVCYCIL